MLQGFDYTCSVMVLLGGGSTTGIISTVGNAGPWVTGKLSAYRDDPIPLENANLVTISARPTASVLALKK